MAKLSASDYLSVEQLMRRERMARARRDAETGPAFLAYAYGNPGGNPYLHGMDQDPQARLEGTNRGSILAEISRIFDPQLSVSLKNFVDRVMAELFPDGVEWAKMAPGDDSDPETALSVEEAADRSEKREEHIAALEPMNRMAFQELHRSNFSEQAPEALLDAVIWRKGVLRARKTETGEASADVSFEHVSQAECSFEWSPNGECWAVYRRHWYSRDEAAWAWPDMDVDALRFDMTESGEPDANARCAFTEATYRVRGKKMWAYQVVQDRGDGNGQVVLEREYRRNPYIVFGATCAPGAKLGRSMAELALATARTLNAMARIVMEAGEFRATPTFTVEQGGIPNPNAIRTTAVGRLIPVKTNEQGSESVKPLDVPGDVRLGVEEMQRLQILIQRICHDENLPPEAEMKIFTATQIIAMQRKAKNRLGAIFNRLMTQLGRPVLQHTLDALHSEKKVEGMTREGGEVSSVELDGKEVAVTFVNPLAQSQRMTDVEDVVSGIETLNGILPPEMVSSALNLEKVPEWMGRQMSWPEMLYRKESKRDELAGQALQAQMMGAGGAGGGSPSAPAQRRPAADASMMAAA